MTQVVVAIGSNYQRELNITAALDALSDHFGELLISPVYESPAIETGHHYYNLVVAFSSDVGASAIKQQLRTIEDNQYRQRHSDQVTLDLDLLLYGDQSLVNDSVHIPHPDILSRDFVLRPLADLLPATLHPLRQQSLQRLWCDFPKHTLLIPVELVWRNRIISNPSTVLPLL